MDDQRDTAPEMGMSERARRLAQHVPAQHLSLLEFVRQAQAIKLTGHGRGWEVMYAGRSLGFADGTQAQALVQVHRREVNNALYAHDSDELGWLWTELPTRAAVEQYPELRSTFALACKKLFGYTYLEVKSGLVTPGWTCFVRLDEAQLPTLTQEGSRLMTVALLIDPAGDAVRLQSLLVRWVDQIGEPISDPAKTQELAQLWGWAERSDAVRQRGMGAPERVSERATSAA